MLIYLILIIAILAILYLLAIMPKIAHRPNFKPFVGCYYAHRGLHQDKDISPENGMTAFKMAAHHNYGIELDVQLSKDNIPVIFHDYNLSRVCGVDKKVSELTYKELQQYTLYHSKDRIPTLQSFLEMVDGRVPLIIEFKVEASNISICHEAMKILDTYNGVYCIESFNPLVLLWFKKNRPNIIRGQLASNLIKDKENGNPFLYFVLQNMLLNFITKPHFIAYNHIHRNMLALKLCRTLYKIPTFAWTISTDKDLESNRNFFDFFIFEQFIPNN